VAEAQVEHYEEPSPRLIAPVAGGATDPDDVYAPGGGDVFVLIVDGRGRVLDNPRGVQEPGLPQAAGVAAALAGRRDTRTVSLAGTPFRILSVPLSGGRAIQVGRSLASSEHELYEIELALVLVGLGGLALAAGGGFLLAGRALRPVRAGIERQRAFVADASHELRAPLTLIRATAETLAQRAERSDDADASLFEDLIAETDRLARLVSDLLLLAQLDEAHPHASDEVTDLRAVVQRAVQRIAPLAGRRPVSGLLGDAALLVSGEAERLGQILFILLDNAVKYTPEDAAISLRAWQSRGQVILTVTDTGPGLSAEAITHAFDRFYRGDTARGHSGGLGLGLAIARALAEAMCGSLQLSRPAGGGLCATLRLPRSDLH